MTGRGFQVSEFAWLAYDEKEGEMFCKVCKLSKYSWQVQLFFLVEVKVSRE